MSLSVSLFYTGHLKKYELTLKETKLSSSIAKGSLTLILCVLNLPEVEHLLQSHIKRKKNNISCCLWKSFTRKLSELSSVRHVHHS